MLREEHETLSSNKCLRPNNPTLQIYIALVYLLSTLIADEIFNSLYIYIYIYIYIICTKENRLPTDRNFIQTLRVSASAFIRGLTYIYIYITADSTVSAFWASSVQC